LIVPTPTISHEEWKRTKALAQIAIGTTSVDTSDLSFEKCVESLTEVPFLDTNDYSDTYHEDFPHGVNISYELNGRERPHRPHISSEVTQLLTSKVKENHEALPAEEFSFEDKLRILLDEVEREFEFVDCTISVEGE
jgi:hypothetical protein